MAIRFLKQWNGYDDQEIVSLDIAEEARLVGLNIATYAMPGDVKYNTDITRGQRAIFIGTSISNQRFVTTMQGYDIGNSWIALMEIVLGHPFTSIIDASVSGRTIAQMVSNWNADVRPYYDNFDWAFLEPGPNSANGGVSGIADVKWMVDELLSIGKKVVLLTPTAPSATILNGANRTAAAELANFCRQYAESLPNVYLADVAAACLENSPDGFNNADMFNNSGDAGTRVHPTCGGHAVMGKTVANALPFLKRSPRRTLNRFNHLEYFPNPSLVGAVASGVRNAQIALGLNTTPSTLPECVGVGMWSGSTFASVATIPLVTKAVDADGRNVMRIEAGGAGGHWHRLFIRFGSTDATMSIPAQVARWDTPWSSGATKTIGDHFRHSGSTTGIFTLVGLSSGDSYVSGAQPALPVNYGDIITDGVATWLWQKIPALGDSFQAEIPFNITSLTGGIVLNAHLFMGVQDNFAGGMSKLTSEFPLAGIDVASPPTKYFPRSGVLRSPVVPIMTAPTNDTMRHAWVDLMIGFNAGGGAVIEVPSASIIRVI